jgi:peptidylprolyl isomerase
MLTILLALQAAAALAPATPKSPSEIIAGAPAADWVDMKADDLLVMQLAPDRAGKARRVVIQLMPPPFSQSWITNIKTLAKAHWWDGTSVNRVQDNYVVQWGDATEKKALPVGMQQTSEQEYTSFVPGLKLNDMPRLAYPDAYARGVTFRSGWQLAYEIMSAHPVTDQSGKPIRSRDGSNAWPVHCYGMVGVGRNLSPDAGNGAELYTVIGHAPRHLDRNIAVVGRVVGGIEHLSSLPRGTGALGFYEDPAQPVPIASIRLASELPQAERPRMQYLSTESASFAAYADARANRKDGFFNIPAGGADICNVPVPIRKRP